MPSSPNATFICPQCGDEVPRGARSCPTCGSDEQTGWSESTYLDGIDLPDDDDYESLREREFQQGRRSPKNSILMVAVSIVLVALFAYGLLRTLM